MSEHPRPLPELPSGYAYGTARLKRLSDEAAPVAKVLSAFGRYARSLSFYAASNRALALFFEELWTSIKAFLAEHGELKLQIDHSRFYFKEEAVYEDLDREQSIPFRLFRDGVRVLILEPDIDRYELMELARILGLGRTGINRHGDDVVTRLWRADLQQVHYEGLEGFVHDLYNLEDEEDRGEVPRIMRRIHGALAFETIASQSVDEVLLVQEEEAAPRWRGGVYPGPAHYELDFPPMAVEMNWPQVSDEDLARIRKERDAEDRQLLPRLLEYLLDLEHGEGEAFRDETVVQLVSDARRYLLSAGGLDELTHVVEYLVEVLHSSDYTDQSKELARGLLDEFRHVDVLAQVITASVSREDGVEVVRGYLRGLREELDGEDVLQLLQRELPTELRELLMAELLERSGKDVGWLSFRLRGAIEPVRMLVVMDLLAALDTAEARTELYRTVSHPRGQVRRHLLRLMPLLTFDAAKRAALVRALQDPTPGIRAAAMEQASEYRDPEMLQAMMALAEREEFARWPLEPREALLGIIAEIDPHRARPWLIQHVKVARVWTLLGAQQKAWNEAVLPALVVVGGRDGLAMLKQLRESGPEEFRRRAQKAWFEAKKLHPEGGR